MSIIGVLSGENQIARLTLGVDQLPLKPLHQIHLQVIFEALVVAWSNLIEACDSQVFQEGEESINRLLVSELNNLKNSEISEWNLLISAVQDAANVPNVDGTRISKQPDISLTLSRRPLNLPFIIECKLINPTKSVDLYCQKGLARFIEGEYAWYDKQSMMLAYVQDQSTIQNKLIPHLNKSQLKKNDLYQTTQPPTAVDWLEGKDLSQSIHRRNFQYVGKYSSCIPGDISVWHLWLTL